MSQATALLADAESSISAGAWDQALEQLENIRQSEPQEPDVYKKLAHVQAVRGKFRSVVATYVELIGVLVGAGQLPEAEKAIHKVLSLNPECIEAREKRIEIEKHRGHTERAVYLARELARLCIEQGDGDRSIRLLQEAQKDQPENLDISLELAEMFVSHGQIQDGANQYRKVANAFQEAGNIGKAAEAYRRMKVVQSDDPEVLLTLGRLYTELGKLDEAEQEFRSVLRHDLEHQDALLELGLVCQLKGRFRSGLLAFNKVLQNNPKLAKAMRKLGELNLSMGKQDEAVQHFLEAAQAYLEEDEKDEAIEVFQIVLGVEEGNAQAQQGLTNLGAPVEPKEFQPPLPPTPPEDEPPTPEAKPISAGEMDTLPPPPPSADAPAPAAEKKGEAPEPLAKKSSSSGLKASSSAGASKTKGGRRKGLVSGGLLRKGLVDPSAGGGKPMLGGKPTLGGGGGSMRAGLRRPGLGMKGAGAEKPMLGMGGGGGGKPTLRRRMPEPEAAPEPEVAEEEVFAAAEADLFDDTDTDSSSMEADFEAAAGDLFGEETAESPFGEGLGDSLFSDDEPESPTPSSSAVSPSPDAGESGVFSTSGATQDSGGDLFDMAGADDLFGDDDSSSGNILFDDDTSGESLFGDSDAGDDLFGDEEPAASVASEGGDDLFGGEQFDSLFEEGEGGDQISSSDTIGSFNRASEVDLFSEPEGAESEPDQDEGGFDLFSEPDSAADSGTSDDLFAFDEEPVAEAEPQSGGGLFDDDAGGGADLFGEDLFPDAEPSPQAKESSGEADDLFSGGDLFSDPEPEKESAGGSIFDEPEAPATQAEEEFGGLFDEPAPAEQGGGGLFEEAPSNDLFGGDDLFGDIGDEPQGSFEEEAPTSAEQPAPRTSEAEEFDLFSEPDEQSDSSFGADFSSEEAAPPAEESGGGLFDGFDDDSPAEDGGLFGSADASAGGLFDEPASENLFGGDEDEPVDLFAEPEVSGSSLGETSLDMEMGGGGSGDLFSEPDQAPGEAAAAPVDDSVGLFDIPDPSDEPAGLFDEPAEEPQAELQSADDSGGSLFDAPDDDGFGFGDESGGSLFDELPNEEPEPATPLGLDLPMPGDPPIGAESEAFQPEEASAVAVEDAPADLFAEEPEGPDEDALTLDKLRAEEMARAADAPAQEPADSPEFMQLLEATLPKAEEEAPPEPVFEESVPEPEDGPLSPMADGGLFDEAVESSADGESLFDELVEEEPAPEPEPEPEPVDEGPQILGKPKVSLSIEDESPASDIDLADKLDASLTGADVAAKIGAYRKALEESPNNLVMRTRLADIHLKYGMLEDALVQYRQVIRRNSESISLLHRVIQAEFWNENYAEAGESLLALAKLHLKRGEHHDALDTLQSVLSLDSHHFEARKVLVSVFTSLDESKLAAHHLRQLAETALTKGEVDEAISAFQQLLEISNDPVFEERLAQIYETQGDMQRALKSFQSLVVRYQQEERWEEAARVTERIVELNPDLLEDRGGLVELYKKLGMNEKAMEQQYRLARAYQERGELEPSVRLYEDVLIHQPHNQNARRLLVDAYLDSQNVSAAMEQAEALTEYYLNTKDHQTAIDLYARLVEAEPENVELQERLVKFYGLAGDPENARQRWISLADLHERKERYDKAAEAIQKALELDENQIELQNRLALLFAEKLDDKVAALTQLRKLFQMAPDRLDAVRMYIEILLKEEQVSEAGQVLQQLEQAGGESAAIKNGVIESLKNKVESNPADLKARFNYGELCYHLGDLDHAIEQFQQTRRSPEFELMSYNMLGMCFAKKKGFNMLDLAIKQFKKGLETRGHGEQAYLELRYNLAMIQYQNGRVAEALNDFKECYRVDIAYRDVRSWIEKIETELASSGS